MNKKRLEERLKMQNISFKLRNIVLAILENDIAYRFPLQDILSEIDKYLLEENPIKEIERVLNIFCGRSKDKRWVEIKRLIIIFLRISKPARESVIRFLLELDLNKIALDGADWYFCLQRPNYKFRGVSLKERLRRKKIIDRREHHFIPDVKILHKRI